MVTRTLADRMAETLDAVVPWLIGATILFSCGMCGYSVATAAECTRRGGVPVDNLCLRKDAVLP
jgi:hypothetical protein